MSNPRRRRRLVFARFLLNRGFQWKYVGYVLLVSTVISVLLGYFIYIKTSINTELLAIEDLEVLSLVRAEDYSVILFLVLFVIGQGLLITGLGLAMTHRIAGPLYVIRQYFEKASTGTFEHFRNIRKHDEFRDVWKSINKTITLLRSEYENDQRIKQKMIEGLESVISECKNKNLDAKKFEELLNLFNTVKQSGQIRFV